MSQEIHTPRQYLPNSQRASECLWKVFSRSPPPHNGLAVAQRGPSSFDLSQGLEPTGSYCHGICLKHSIARAVIPAAQKAKSAGS